MILTTVRSLLKEDIPDLPSHSWVNENLGFVTDEHLMNVAITRAEEALCIIGRSTCVSCVSTKELIVQKAKRTLLTQRKLSK